MSTPVRCPACGVVNNVDPGRPGPRCGACKAPLPVGGAPITVTDASYQALVLSSPVPVLLDLWAPWCGPCRMVAPILEQLAKKYNGKITVAKLNVDENPDTAQRLEARSIPLMVYFKNGVPVQRLVGAMGLSEIERSLGLSN
ncbi:thioredoxin [Leptospirillum ferrooxidans]|uniref:thioredoxin n=1 Tax=Leptospirillum ferrooxidans TaxID=180 RepID=UPI0009D95B8F|nr:thioredoxin [Leptospirillum ferrooxidans]